MYKLIRPILFKQDPEKDHKNAIKFGKFFGKYKISRGIISLLYSRQDRHLAQQIDGLNFRNPVGLAAGFDKDCELMDIVPCIGFGFEEVGSITSEPYEGNKGIRLLRLPADKALIVNYGLKNQGAGTLRRRLQRNFKIPIGVSVAKTNRSFDSQEDALNDWLTGIKALKDVGDYLAINLSCPNTSDNTNYCAPDNLEKLILHLDKLVFEKPVFLKLSWNIEEPDVDKIIALCKNRLWIRGFILTNLAKDRSKLELETLKEVYQNQPGGISGPKIKKHSLELVKAFRKKGGTRFTLVGVGGISSAEDAYEYVKAGCNLVQILTGMIYEGPSLVGKINKNLVKLLNRDGYTHITEAVGRE